MSRFSVKNDILKWI